MRPRPLRSFLIALVAAALAAPAAGAALKKYKLLLIQINESTNVSPNPKVTPGPSAGETWVVPPSRAVIDDSGPSPILKHLSQSRDGTATTLVPALGGFIFTPSVYTEGPIGEFTGTGSTDTTIAWGLLTGWTITGTYWCNSSPAFICGLATRVYRESNDPSLLSPFYDLGTWTFHGTGWTASPYVNQTYVEPGSGNMQYLLSGHPDLSGTIPALPAVGLGVVVASLVFGSLAALRGRKG